MTKEELIKNQFPNDEFLRSAVLQIVDKCTAELEKENEQLTVSYETLKLHNEEEIGMLKSENAELKNKLKHRNCLDCSNHHINIKLFKAKALLAKWVELYKPKSDTALPTPIQVDTEQFIKDGEVEK